MPSPARSIDLNADLGEGAGADAALLEVVTSASIACGGHAGSIATMREAVQRAQARSVVIGAHPSYPDRDNFGRTEIRAAAKDIERWVIEQVDTLRNVSGELGASVRYVKPHGALYNRAVRDREAADAIAAAVRAIAQDLVLLGPSASAMLDAAEAAGLRTAREAFLDRAYNPDGSLVSRATQGAVLADPAAAGERAFAIAAGSPIRDAHGAALHIAADSLCVHGDSPAALAIARAVKARLLDEGIVVRPFA